MIRKVNAEDIAIRGNGTGLEYMCPTRHFVYIFFNPVFQVSTAKNEINLFNNHILIVAIVTFAPAGAMTPSAEFCVSKISQELLYLETWNFVHRTSMTSCIVGKKIGAVGSGHLELFPFVVLAICVCNIYFVSKISQELLNLESWKLVHITSMTSCIVGKKIGLWGSGHLRVISLCCSGYLCVSKHLFCVKDFSRTTVPRILKFCTHDKYD